MAQWIIQFITEYGYVAIALLMLLENVFPPIPSELIMPFAGFVAARGDLHPAGVVITGTLGSIAGTLPWYWAGRAIGLERLQAWADRHGRWLTVSREDLTKAQAWFERRGWVAVTLGRLVPALRSIISAPAGIARMPMHSFLFWSALGSLVWTSALTAVGYLLDNRYEAVVHWLDPVTKAVLALALLTYVWRLVTFGKRHKP
ncbi:MAG: alkaline phosphatase [Polaromonas sp.]|jgi:membrane protein DedA with SNARE-associated domain|nr:alkaline phosphatase [Polaromonas sp.]